METYDLSQTGVSSASVLLLTATLDLVSFVVINHGLIGDGTAACAVPSLFNLDALVYWLLQRLAVKSPQVCSTHWLFASFTSLGLS